MRASMTFVVLFLSLPLSFGAGELIPPHRSQSLRGVHAYPDAESVPAGGVIRFHVSAEVSYRMRISRLGVEVDDVSSDRILFETENSYPAKPQPIHPGSYVHVEKGLSPEKAAEALSIEVWVRPWKLEGWQGLVTQHDFPVHCGVGLFLNGPEVVWYLGDGGELRQEQMEHRGGKLELRQWHHVVGTWDRKVKRLWIDGKNVGEWAIDGVVRAGKTALRLGASGEQGRTDHFFDGDLAMPVIYRRALSEGEVFQRFESQALKTPAGEHVLAGWALDEERGDRVADFTGTEKEKKTGRDGRIINRGTWMIGGPSFDGTKVPRYGGRYDPAKDATRGHALRLASDDLYDCRWEAVHVYPVPADAKSGIYAARFLFHKDGEDHSYPVTFIVGKRAESAKAPIAVMCATNTWRAYEATPFAKNQPTETQQLSTDGAENGVGNPPAYSCYRDHRHGQPTYQIGRRIPWPVAGPGIFWSPLEIGFSHLMRGERFTHAWLEKSGYRYDVITNYDLDRKPELLDGYRVLVINGHDEYWSDRMWKGIDRFLRAGGNLVVLSGNTAFWRVSFGDDGAVMECRKFQSDLGGRPPAIVGEIYHSHDGHRGSLMRNCGYPAWRVTGLECVGWWGGGKAENFAVYRVSESEHFLFHRPEQVDLKPGETFGHAVGGGLPRAGGHEADVRLRTLAAYTGAPPDGAGPVPAEPAGIVTLAAMSRKNQRVGDYFMRWQTVEPPVVIAEMIYWERPEGGRVFNAATIASGWALSADPKLQTLLRNVLHHFGVEPEGGE
jgi:N,N-dimethylformamidase